MANHRSSFRIPSYARVTRDIEYPEIDLHKGDIVRIEKFDAVNNEYTCVRTSDHEMFCCLKEDDLREAKVKKFAVDVHFDIARSFEIYATDANNADEQIERLIKDGVICCTTGGFEQTDDYECNTSGEEDENGKIAYY